MRDMKGFYTYKDEGFVTIENEYGQEFRMEDNEVLDCLPDAFYEYIQDKLSSFYY